MSNKKITRMNKIINIMKMNTTSSVKELASMLNFSEMTIRRDLNVLEASNIITIVHGAVIYNQYNTVPVLNQEYELTQEMVRLNKEKERLGKFATTLIEPNDTIIFDTGTTTEKIVHNISDNEKITALCYNLNILQELSKKNNIDIIFGGGYYHPNTQMFESPESLQLINRIRANKVFVSAAGIHDTLGVTCVHKYEVLTKNAIIKSAKTKILVADSSKFGVIRSALFAQLNTFDIIITDNNLTSNWIDYINNMNIKLYIV